MKNIEITFATDMIHSINRTDVTEKLDLSYLGSTNYFRVHPIIQFDRNTFYEFLEAYKINLSQLQMITNPLPFELGEFPQSLANSSVPDTLTKSSFTYTLMLNKSKFSLKKFKVYFKGDKKYIKAKLDSIDKKKWYRIKPIQWEIDYINHRLVSTKALFVWNGLYPEDMKNFESTDLYDYLNNQFLNEIFQFEKLKVNQHEISKKEEPFTDPGDDGITPFTGLARSLANKVLVKKYNGYIDHLTEINNLLKEYLKKKGETIFLDAEQLNVFIERLVDIELRVDAEIAKHEETESDQNYSDWLERTIKEERRKTSK